MIGHGGNEYTTDDGHWCTEAHGENECKQLGFVADFSNGDCAERYEEGFQG